MLTKGDLLVPVETPYGPPPAREAWAEELRQLAVVTGVSRDGLTVTINVPSTAETRTLSLHALMRSYELSEPDDPFGRSWSASLERAAVEGARVDPETFGGRGDPAYWERVAAVIGRVLREEAVA